MNVLSVILLVTLTVSLINTQAFAELDLEFEEIVSTDNNLVLVFGETTTKFFRTYADIIPHLDAGTVDFGYFEVTLDRSATVKIMGDSFVVHQGGVVLYAYNLGDDKFRINAMANTETGLIKKTFTASITQPERTVYIEPEIIIEEPIIQMFSFVKTTNFVGEDLTVSVRITDDEMSRGLNTIGGGIYGAEMKLITGQNGQTLRTDEGKTNQYGVWNGSVLLTDGVYIHSQYVDVLVTAKWNDQYLSEEHRVWLTYRSGG